MASPDSPNATHATLPGESTTSTRQPTQLAVLLASAGSVPLDHEQLRAAATRIWDAFVLTPERARLLVHGPRALFAERATAVDLRHDALAQAIRVVGSSLRQRLDTYDSAHPNAALLRGVPALAASAIESAVHGSEARRGAFIPSPGDLMLGTLALGVDALASSQAGVMRRLVALSLRGMMVEKPRVKSLGLVNDLGAVTLVLSLLDVLANPRSALRAARLRVSKAQKSRADDVLRVRVVSEALRELIGHAISSATTSGAAGRELVKEATLPPALLDLFVVAMARATCDGLAPDSEHPLMVPGAGEADSFTVEPVLVAHDDEDDPVGPTLGLYNRIAFVPIAYAAAAIGNDVRVGASGTRVPRPSRGLSVDESAIHLARSVAERTTASGRADTVPSSVLDSVVDVNGATVVVSPTPAVTAADRVASVVMAGSRSVHFVIVTGEGTAGRQHVFDALAHSLAATRTWHVLSPRPTDQTLAFEPVGEGEAVGLLLARSDLAPWLTPRLLRAIQWDLPMEADVVLVATGTDATRPEALEYAARLVRAVTERTRPRTVLVLLGVATQLDAAAVLAMLRQHPELETGEYPVRTDAVQLVRTAVAMSPGVAPAGTVDVALLRALAEGVVGASPLADLCARSMLAPRDARVRGRALRLAALRSSRRPPATVLDVLARIAADPTRGSHLRRAMLASVFSAPSTRAALAAGLHRELVAGLEHERDVLLAEWDRAEGLAAPIRAANLARGMTLEHMLAAHGRAALLVDGPTAAALAGLPLELYEPVSVLDGMHGESLGLQATGTVCALSAARRSIPLGFVLRGGTSDLYLLVEPVVGPLPLRAMPLPNLELRWQPGTGETNLAHTTAVAASLHELARRWTREVGARSVAREGRNTFAALVDLSLRPDLYPESLRLLLPLRAGVDDAEVQRLAVEVVTRLAEVAGGDPQAEWTAVATVDTRGPEPVSLSSSLLVRQVCDRWRRAIDQLGRGMPERGRTDAVYLPSVTLGTAAELGIAAAVMAERGMAASSAAGRALLTRLPSAITEIDTAFEHLVEKLPLRTTAEQGADLEVLERCLAIAWFLHVNFCVAAPGPLQWSPPDSPHLADQVRNHLDATAMRAWFKAKTSRPESVDARMREFLDRVDPSVIVDREH